MWNIFQILKMLENFRKNLDFENFVRNFDRKFWSKIWPKFRSIFLDFFRKKIKIWKYFTFFTFWDGFFMDFQNFWCYGKRRCPLLIRFLCLFYKIHQEKSCDRRKKNVTVSGHKRLTFLFPVSCSLGLQRVIIGRCSHCTIPECAQILTKSWTKWN